MFLEKTIYFVSSKNCIRLSKSQSSKSDNNSGTFCLTLTLYKWKMETILYNVIKTLIRTNRVKTFSTIHVLTLKAPLSINRSVIRAITLYYNVKYYNYISYHKFYQSLQADV